MNSIDEQAVNDWYADQLGCLCTNWMEDDILLADPLSSDEVKTAAKGAEVRFLKGATTLKAHRSKALALLKTLEASV